MFESVEEVRLRLERVVGDLEPELLAGAAAARLVETFAAVEKLCAVGKALAARRVEETDAWRRSGRRSAADWLAATTGESYGSAAAALDTAHRLKSLPGTDEAFRAGRLSATQAREIASAAAAAPSCEAQLLETAGAGSVKELQDRCRQVRLAAADENLAYRRIHAARYFRTFTDRDGAFRLDGRLTPDDGARLLVALEPYKERAFRDARAAGRREAFDAYAADALVAMAEDAGLGGGRRGPKATIQVRVDRAALDRGRAEPGEICEIAGAGPVPVAVVERLAADAVVKGVAFDGADVTAVAHLGRSIPAKLRTALEARDPICCVPGCTVGTGLEIDHRKPFALGGPASLENTARLCRFHHAQKTFEGWRLEGEPGEWRWVAPDLVLVGAPP